jgi:hypothetical protein
LGNHPIKIIAGTDKTIRVMLFYQVILLGIEKSATDDSKTVIEIVGVAETMAVLEEFNQINEFWSSRSI